MDYTSDYCEKNRLLLNVNKSISITFTLQKTISTDPLVVSGGLIGIKPEIKLLGVIFDEHLRFTSHVDHVIERTKLSMHGLIKLKRCGVDPWSLALFYRARILSILSYAAPCWYPHIADRDKDKLERFQKLCMKIIIPDEEDYETRLSILKLDEFHIHMDLLCFRFLSKVGSNDQHPCYRYICKEKKNFNRTTLLDNNVFHKYR